MTTLSTFIRALEKVTGKSYVTGITYIPLRMPAYKEFTITLKEFGGETFVQSYKVMVTSEEEKTQAIEKCTESFIASILKKLLKGKGIENEVI